MEGPGLRRGTALPVPCLAAKEGEGDLGKQRVDQLHKGHYNKLNKVCTGKGTWGRDMLQVVTGGSASGKSAYAEKLVQGWGTPLRYYLATMQPWGEEGALRAARHRNMRAGKGFVTVEAYHHLEALSFGFGPQGGSGAAQDTAILLECMSNLVANEQFQAGGSDEEVLGRIDRGIRRLQDCAAYVAVVTNEVFSDGAGYGEETMRYLRLLGQANRRLAAVADRVVEVVYGLEVEWKPLRPPNGSG